MYMWHIWRGVIQLWCFRLWVYRPRASLFSCVTYQLGWSLFCNFWNLHFSSSNCVPLCKKTYFVKYNFNWTTFRGSSMTLKFWIILISSRQIRILLCVTSMENILLLFKVFTTLLFPTALTWQIVVNWSFYDR